MSHSDQGRVARIGSEQGAVLPLMALLLVVLLGVVGFAVDLGWLYWNSVEIQHGADAAALSGVIYVANDADKAKVEGRAAAAENGFVDGTLGGPDVVDIVSYTDDASAVANSFQLRATVTHQVPTFFMTVFGMNTVDVSHTAVAEYVKPLPLGSP